MRRAVCQFHVDVSAVWDLLKTDGEPVTFKVWRQDRGMLTLPSTARSW